VDECSSIFFYDKTLNLNPKKLFHRFFTSNCMLSAGKHVEHESHEIIHAGIEEQECTKEDGCNDSNHGQELGQKHGDDEDDGSPCHQSCSSRLKQEPANMNTTATTPRMLQDYERSGNERQQMTSHDNINVRGAYLHALGDWIQSVGVMIAGALIWYNPNWQIIDLVCTHLFSLLVLATTIQMLRNIVEILMETTPREIDAAAVESGLSRSALFFRWLYVARKL
jgi:zinc transporter 2